MGLRLLPFRQYNEHDVINIFSFDPAIVQSSSSSNGATDNGIIVKVADNGKGSFNQDTITYGTDSYLGKTDYPFVGADMYPKNPLHITGTEHNQIAQNVLGVTLLQTAKEDENGEKLLYNATKREELQAVLPGQSVPVATRGIFTFSDKAFANATAGSIKGSFQIGGAVVAMGTGTISGIAKPGAAKVPLIANVSGNVIGTVIGTGERNGVGTYHANGSTADQFSGAYVVVKLG